MTRRQLQKLRMGDPCRLLGARGSWVVLKHNIGDDTRTVGFYWVDRAGKRHEGVESIDAFCRMYGPMPRHTVSKPGVGR